MYIEKKAARRFRFPQMNGRLFSNEYHRIDSPTGPRGNFRSGNSLETCPYDAQWETTTMSVQKWKQNDGRREGSRILRG